MRKDMTILDRRFNNFLAKNLDEPFPVGAHTNALRARYINEQRESIWYTGPDKWQRTVPYAQEPGDR